VAGEPLVEVEARIVKLPRVAVVFVSMLRFNSRL
jgi:hypothetical protein